MTGNSSSGFSLVEVTLALGIASLCLIAVFGLVPIGVQTNRTAIAQTAAVSILSSVTADLRSTPQANTTSAVFGIPFGTTTTLYFNGEGTFSPVIDVNSRYRLVVTFPASPAGSFAPTFASLRVTWPAAADPLSPSGSTETFAAFDRN